MHQVVSPTSPDVANRRPKRRPKRRRWVRTLVVATALAFGLVLAFEGAASAHGFPVSTTPQAGARLAVPPTEVTIHFSERVAASAAHIAVRTSTGRSVPTGALQLTGGSTTSSVPLIRPGNGIYVVTWSVTAADGHDSAGEFAFAVGAVHGKVPAPALRSTTVPVAESLATALFLAGVALAIGGLFSERFVWRPVVGDDMGTLTTPLAPVAIGLALGLVGATAQLFLLVRTEPGGILGTDSWRDVLVARPGLFTLAELVAVAYALWILRFPRMRGFALVPLTGAVIAAALRGHSGTGGEWWAATANALHFVLGGLWVGALVHLVRVIRHTPTGDRRARIAAGATRYASMAIVAIPPLLALGVVTALGELDHWSDLVDTTYGVILLAKIGLVGAALALALLARMRALRPERIEWGALRRFARPEAAVLLAVVTISGFLASSAPPSPAATAGYVLGPAPLTGEVQRSAALAGQLAIYLGATKDILRIEILAPGGNAPENARVSIEGTRPDGHTFELFPRRCGTACVTTNTRWAAGTTQLAVAVSAPGWTGGNAHLAVTSRTGPDASADLERIIATMRALPHVTVHERVSSNTRGRSLPGGGDFTGPAFIANEPYVRGATDVHALPDRDGLHRLALFLTASQLWAEFTYDDSGRLTGQLVIDPGHEIRRTFEYPANG